MESNTGELYREGITAIGAIAGRMGPEDWIAPACGEWTAGETVRHLLGVARWYGDWLDRALAGDNDRPFGVDDLPERNAAVLAELVDLSGPDAVREFTTVALAHLDRAEAHLDLPYGYPFGTVTAGLHLGVAATEWHLHAWDLSTVAGPRHVPDDPSGVFLAAGRCVAAATGGVSGAVLNRLVPLGARLTPWKTLLKKSGRTP